MLFLSNLLAESKLKGVCDKKKLLEGQTKAC